jgi:hypothetical protein
MWPSYTNIKGLPSNRGTINIKDSKYQIQRSHKGEGRNKRLVTLQAKKKRNTRAEKISICIKLLQKKKKGICIIVTPLTKHTDVIN